MSREQYATMRIDNLTKNDILTNNAHRGFVGRPDLKSFGELMEYAKNHREQILEQKKQAMQLTSEKFTWGNAVKEMTRRFE